MHVKSLQKLSSRFQLCVKILAHIRVIHVRREADSIGRSWTETLTRTSMLSCSGAFWSLLGDRSTLILLLLLSDEPMAITSAPFGDRPLDPRISILHWISQLMRPQSATDLRRCTGSNPVFAPANLPILRWLPKIGSTIGRSLQQSNDLFGILWPFFPR
jgi:hypothetical protein